MSTAAQILLTTPPPDDAGAETYARYDWQAAMATADVLALYFDLSPGAGPLPTAAALTVICEHHEDWALTDGTGAEIISAKHHEREFGTYSTLKELLDEGGVLHLFDRWVALQKSPRCRLVTTSELKNDAKLLKTACAHFAEQTGPGLDVGDHTRIVKDLATAISKRRLVKLKKSDSTATLASIKDETPETLAEFLQVLTLDCGRPFRDELVFSAVNRYAMPVANLLERPDAAEAIWNAVFSYVQQRMRAAGECKRGGLPHVLGASDEEDYEERKFDLRDVETIIGVALANPSGLKALPQPIRTTKVAVKMSEGGCLGNSIARAEDLRLQYRSHWRTANSGPSRTAAQQKVANVLQRVVDEETANISTGTEKWGPELWSAVQARMDTLAGDPTVDGLDANLLMGGVAELSNRCKVWFTPEFDPDERMRTLVEEATK